MSELSKIKTFAVIGGDKRQLYLADSLARDGFRVILGGFDKLYYRNLLYTAVTRAKKLLIIVGTSSAVSRMVENNRRSLRYSCLRDMLTSE